MRNLILFPGAVLLCWLLVVASAVDLILASLSDHLPSRWWVGYVGTQRDLAFPASKGDGLVLVAA